MAVVAALAPPRRTSALSVGVAAHDVQQRRLARGLVMGDSRFDEVAGAVQLVGVA
jgi:hypothetical protein